MYKVISVISSFDEQQIPAENQLKIFKKIYKIDKVKPSKVESKKENLEKYFGGNLRLYN